MNITREAVHHPDSSLRCMRLQLKAFAGGLHRHHHAELTWVERGCGLRWVGEAVEPFADGDLVLVGSELPHQWASERASDKAGEGAGERPVDTRRGAGACVATVLQFPADWPLRTGLPELQPLQGLLARARAGLVVSGPAHAVVTGLLQRMPSAGAAQRVAALVQILATLHEAGSELRAISPRRLAAAPAGPATLRSERVIEWVRTRLGQELRVEQAAALVHVSPAAFARLFRREVGKSFTEFVNDARCSWAALRLAQTQEPVAEIALACGYPTLSNFGEQFRRRQGCSPREFRQRARGA